MNKYLTFSFIAIVGVCGWWLSSVLDERTSLRDDVEHLKADVVRQNAIIKRSNELSSFYNLVTRSVIDNQLQLQASNEERKVEYKEIIKTEYSCNYYVPQRISDGLLKYTSTIRARALSVTSVGANNPRISQLSRSKRLTYCNAVLWIDDLLTVIDKEHGKLEAIRKIEEQRASQ